MTGIILAGGKNSRISTSKAHIKMGKHTIIEKAVNLFRDIFNEIIIITNKPDDYTNLGVKLASDIIPGKGPLGGIYSGLKLSSNHYNFIVACDMPFLESSIIQYLQRYSNNDLFDVIVPEYNGFIEPLFAIYSRNCIEPIEKNLKNNQLKIRCFFTQVRVKEVPCNKFNSVEKSFFNINTKEDLHKARRLDCG